MRRKQRNQEIIENRFEDLVHENAQRKELRSMSISVGVCLIAYLVIQYGVVLAMGLLGLRDLYLKDPVFFYSVSGLLSVLSIGLPFLIVSLRRGRLSYIGALPFNAPKSKIMLVCGAIGGLAVCVSANYVVSALITMFGDFGVSLGDEIKFPEADGPLAFALMLFNTVVTPAIVEEFAFRGVIMQPLRRYGNGFAILTSSFIFACAHGTPTGMIFAFIVGLALGYVTIETGSLWTGMALHAANNLFSVITNDVIDLKSNEGMTAYLITVSVIMVLGIAACTVFAVMVGIKHREPMLGRHEAKISGRYREYLLSLPMVIGIVLLVAGSFSLIGAAT